MKLFAGLACLCVLAATGYALSAERADRHIEIRINHSGFDARSVTVAQGETVEFTIVNDDPIDHEFIVGDDAVQRAHELGTEAYHADRPTEITVPAGTTRTTVIDFDADSGLALAQPLFFGCHLPRHYDYGMKGVVRVLAGA